METTRVFVDRDGWGPGPWESEPDRIAWTDEATGYPCIMRRGNSGAWCGYVAVPTGHPFHGRGYHSCLENCGEEWCNHGPEYRVEVHGGLTYADACSDDAEYGVCHVAKPGEPDVWWFGFDCAHAGDAMPGMRRYGMRLVDCETYRDVAYVRAEVLRLARQLKECA